MHRLRRSIGNKLKLNQNMNMEQRPQLNKNETNEQEETSDRIKKNLHDDLTLLLQNLQEEKSSGVKGAFQKLVMHQDHAGQLESDLNARLNLLGISEQIYRQREDIQAILDRLNNGEFEKYFLDPEIVKKYQAQIAEKYRK